MRKKQSRPISDLINDVGELIEVGAYCPFGKNMPRPLLSAIAPHQDDFGGTH